MRAAVKYRPLFEMVCEVLFYCAMVGSMEGHSCQIPLGWGQALGSGIANKRAHLLQNPQAVYIYVLGQAKAADVLFWFTLLYAIRQLC